MKKKVIEIKKLIISNHPVVQQLTSQDNKIFSPQKNLNSISPLQLDILLQQICLPVAQNTSEPESYFLLKPCPDFLLLEQHPDAKNKKIQLHIYDEEESSLVIPTLLFQHRALHYETFKACSENLRARWSLAKELGITRPSLKALSNLAGVDHSTFRKIK